MNGHGSSNIRRDTGFSTVEMVILLAVLVVFLAGVVILAARGVSTFDTAKGATTLYEESDRLFDRIGALLSSGRAISLEQSALTPASNTRRLVFVADLDGTGGKIKAASNGAGIDITGLETVALFRPLPRSNTLVARVWGNSSESDKVVLTSLLDPTKEKAFAIEYLDEGGKSIDPDTAGANSRSVSAVKVTAKLQTGDESRSFTRLFRLESPIPVMQISLGAGSLR